jgi:hypothetical protein
VIPETKGVFTAFLDHEKRWQAINRELKRYGYTMGWMSVRDVDGYRYLMHRLHPYEKLGYWDDEETAINMARMVLTQASIER